MKSSDWNFNSLGSYFKEEHYQQAEYVVKNFPDSQITDWARFYVAGYKLNFDNKISIKKIYQESEKC